MRRFILFIVSLLFVSGNLIAQNYVAVKDAEKQGVIDMINVAASGIRSMSCTFVQTKELSLLDDKIVSHGRMYFTTGNKLRWEYLKPYHYTFILNGDTVLLKSDGKQDKIDISTNRIFSQIASIMMSSITGKCVQEGKDFKVAAFTSDEGYKIVLTPLKKEIKQVFCSINLFYDVKDSVVKRVELVENTGDSTTIELENIVKNGTVDEAVFDIGN